MAADCGFSAAASLPSIGLPDDITRLLSRLPSDRIRVMLVSIEIVVPCQCRVHNMKLSSLQVDEAQSFFLLEKTGGVDRLRCRGCQPPVGGVTIIRMSHINLSVTH